MGHCRSRRIFPMALSLFVASAFLLLACNSPVASRPPAQTPPTPTEYADADSHAGRFVGAYDEIIGADGRAGPGFSDADYVQLLRPDDIPPIYAPQFVAASDANLPDDELVIGLAVNGDARAYPAGILYTREMVNDVVGGAPVLVTWCPRCYTALVHRRPVDGIAAGTADTASETAAVFGNQGALYHGAMTWYDHDTGSVWSQPLGMAIAGPAAGRVLPLLSSQLTTWKEWRTAHPDTLALVVGEPAPPFRGRRPGPEHIVGVVVGDAAAAWPYASIVAGPAISATVGGTTVALWQDADTGAIRAKTTDANGNHRQLPVIIAYRQAWLKFYPDDTLR